MKALALAVIFVLATVVCSTPTREKRSALAMAGAGFPFGTGAFAGGGFGWPVWTSPFDYPRAYYPSYAWPVFTFPKPWYEGDNVCTTSKEIQDPKELQEWFSEVSGGSGNVDYSQQSEQCQGSGTKYVCFKRYISNGESKMQITKYECCHGFVRNPAGPGCIESAPAESNGRPNEYYYFPQQQAASSSSSSSRTNVGGVPIQ